MNKALHAKRKKNFGRGGGGDLIVDEGEVQIFFGWGTGFDGGRQPLHEVWPLHPPCWAALNLIQSPKFFQAEHFRLMSYLLFVHMAH